MADIAEQFIVYLKTVSGITTLVGSGTSARILQQDGMKESGTRPAICINLQGDESIDHLGGESTLRKADIAVSGFADSPGDRNTLAAAVEAALPLSISGNAMGSLSVTECDKVQPRSDGDQVATDASDQRIYFSQYVYRIWYYSS
jgi:hypothetical protein